jgi:hypothetical protein
MTALPMSSFSTDNHWVVGFGFGSTSIDQYQELMEILSSCGMIDQKMSGGNWVAVHFLSRYSAEKAVSCQPIFSIKSNIYYGISSVTSERLRILQQHKSKLDKADGVLDSQQQPLLAISHDSVKTFEEQDVLMHGSDADVLNRPTKPENICQQLMAWYFGWTYDTSVATAMPKHLKSE